MFVYIAGRLMKNEWADTQQQADDLIESLNYQVSINI